MKTTMLSVIGCALLAANVLPARAQTTNVTLNVNIALTGVASSNDSIAHVKISTKDVINAIGTDFNTNGGPAFTASSKLVAVSGGGGSGPSFLIRTGTNDFPVPDGVLAVANVGDSVRATKTSSTGAITGTETSIDNFVLSTSTLSFNVQGYTTASVSNRGRGRDLLPDTSPVALSSKVNGNATSAAGNSVVQGVISASGRKVEIAP